MQTLSASTARTNLYRLIDETAESHQPLVITGKRNNAVLVSADDWAAMQETLFLLSVPNMRESIREGMNTPVSELAEKLDW
ncbi:MAG TPA: type II toxin-antitoxin system Phd/YefM family antitoxin [Methylotenera sp.]|nr:type II toxin-antitoxin system Phd/YefM family antitoxin [Methylotenera sp.]